jgi:hypothetical protein
MEQNSIFWNSRRVYGQQISKKIVFVISQCLYNNRLRFSRQIDWCVTFLSFVSYFKDYKPKFFQGSWIKSGQENLYFYLFVLFSSFHNFIFLKRIGIQSFLQNILNFMSTFELDNGLFFSPYLISKTSPQLFLLEMIFES